MMAGCGSDNMRSGGGNCARARAGQPAIGAIASSFSERRKFAADITALFSKAAELTTLMHGEQCERRAFSPTKEAGATMSYRALCELPPKTQGVFSRKNPDVPGALNGSTMFR